MFGSKVAVGQARVVDVGNRCTHGGERGSDLLVDGWLGAPGFWTDEDRAETRWWALGVIDEADDSRMIQLPKNLGLVAESIAVDGSVGGVNGNQPMTVHRDGHCCRVLTVIHRYEEYMKPYGKC